MIFGYKISTLRNEEISTKFKGGDTFEYISIDSDSKDIYVADKIDVGTKDPKLMDKISNRTKHPKDKDMNEISTKDPYEMNQDELQIFFARKEEQYAERREKIANLCSMFDLVFQARKSNVLFQIQSGRFVYAKPFKVAYCLIPKVSEMKINKPVI